MCIIYQHKSYRVGELSMYELLVTANAPRPIAWIVTENEDGTSNVAPFSFCFVASVNPPVVGFVPLNPKAGSGKVIKDSLANIKRTGQFTYNVATRENMKLVNDSSVDLAYGNSEAIYVGIPLADSVVVRPKIIAVSPIALECITLADGIISLGTGELAGTIVLGHIQHVHIADSILKDEKGTIDASLLHLVARMEGPYWVGTNRKIKMPGRRKPWKKYKG